MKPTPLALLASLSFCTAVFAAEASAPAQKQASPDSRQELAGQIADLEKTDPKDSYLARLTSLDVEKQKALKNGDQARANIIAEEMETIQATAGAGGKAIKPEDAKKKPAISSQAAPEKP